MVGPDTCTVSDARVEAVVAKRGVAWNWRGPAKDGTWCCSCV